MLVLINSNSKCLPVDRTLPAKCERCSEKELPCSEPQSSSNKRLNSKPGPALAFRSRTPSDATDSDSVSPRREVPVDPQRVLSMSSPPVNRVFDSTIKRKARELMRKVIPMRNEYSYDPLNEDETRLLYLQSGQLDEPLRCFLVPISTTVPGNPEYQALSYVWGIGDPNNEISILSYKSGSLFVRNSIQNFSFGRFCIRSNLYTALQHLRKPSKDVILWVDAICIDQRNADEKSSQVAKKPEIFQRASNVIIWLGPETATSPLAFDFVPKVLDLEHFDDLITQDSTSRNWLALAELMRNPLFGRLWFIPELSFAREATLQCGAYIVRWAHFADVVALFEANLDMIQKMLVRSQSIDRGPLDDVRHLPAIRLVKMVNNLLRKTSEGRVIHRNLNLDMLVSRTSRFEATDPRDTIYAMFGLARDLPYMDFGIDYNREPLEVYTDYVSYCIQSSRSTDILCRHWAPITKKPSLREHLTLSRLEQSKLPSWIATVAGSAFGAAGPGPPSRSNGDSLVGGPGCNIYNASYRLPMSSIRFGRLPDNDPDKPGKYDGTMYVMAHRLDRIDEIAQRSLSGMIVWESIDLGCRDDPSDFSEQVPDKLWRTFVADRGPDNSNPPTWYQRACIYCFAHSDANGDIDTKALIDLGVSAMVTEYLKRVQSVIWNRRFFLSAGETKGQSFYGFAPSTAKGEDVIYIIHGCSVPVILREHRTNDDLWYEVVGESFIYGMMDGEAYEMLKDTPAVELKLR